MLTKHKEHDLYIYLLISFIPTMMRRSRYLLIVIFGLFSKILYFCLLVEENRLQKVEETTEYRPGDRVQSYELIERSNSLGQKSVYELNYHWTCAEYALMLPSSQASSQDNIESVTLTDSTSECIGQFCMDNNIFHGGHGDVWRAHKVEDGERIEGMQYILKRMRVHMRPHIKMCAEREIYFGNLLRKFSAYPRFITFFIHNEDYWLVFKDEGTSLQALLYSSSASSPLLLKPSPIWLKLRTTEAGKISMQGIMHQVIISVAKLHRMGIVHRDIKPSNILLNMEGDGEGGRVLIGDFSSAVKEDMIDRLYGSFGPTVDEETLSYAPPEVLLSPPPHPPYHLPYPPSYDVWSVGVLFLELVLGTGDVFNVDQRTSAMLAQRIGRYRVGKAREQAWMQRAILLASLADYCIYQRPSALPYDESIKKESRRYSAELSLSGMDILPRENTPALNNKFAAVSCADKHDVECGEAEEVKDAKKKDSERESDSLPFHLLLAHHQTNTNPSSPTKPCTIADFAQAIKRRDSLGKGLEDPLAVDLLFHLLQFDPLQRWNLSDALRHPYFGGGDRNRGNEGGDRGSQRGDEGFSGRGGSGSTKGDIQEDAHVVHIRSNDGADSINGMLLQPYTYTSSPTEDDGEDEHLYGMSYSLSIFMNPPLLSPPTTTSALYTQTNVQTHIPTLPQHYTLLEGLEFVCGVCGRRFKGEGGWGECRKHIHVRKHLAKGEECEYAYSMGGGRAVSTHREGDDGTSSGSFTAALHTHRNNRLLLMDLLSSCYSPPPYLPPLPHSPPHTPPVSMMDVELGWCDQPGRRRRVEDRFFLQYPNRPRSAQFQMHTAGVFLTAGVLDGHFGVYAAEYVGGRVKEIWQGLLREREVGYWPGDVDIEVDESEAWVNVEFASEEGLVVTEAMGVDTRDDVSHDEEDIDLENVVENLAKLNERVNLTVIEDIVVGDSEDILCFLPCEEESSECIHPIHPSSCPHTPLTVKDARRSLKMAFIYTNEELRERHIHTHPLPRMTDVGYVGGTTASLLTFIGLGSEDGKSESMDSMDSGTSARHQYVMGKEKVVVVSNVGDSTVVLCCYWGEDEGMRALVVTTDHTPKVKEEVDNVMRRGGFVEKGRVNGVLEVTRSLGDPLLSPFLSAQPDVKVLRLALPSSPFAPIKTDMPPTSISPNQPSSDLDGKVVDSSEYKSTRADFCLEYMRKVVYGESEDAEMKVSSPALYPLFFIAASDGFWDVFSSIEVIHLVCADLLAMYAEEEVEGVWQRISEHLSQEAVLRMSGDNIGVLLISLH